MRRFSLVFFAALLAGGCATAKQHGRLALHDAAQTARAPFHASKKTWGKAGMLAGAVAASTLLDDRIADALQSESDQADNVAENVEGFGGGNSDKVLAGFLLAGLAGRQDREINVAFDGFVTSILASKIITPAIKELAHRERPNGQADDSFPSGHATQAFAVASVIASHYEQRWVDVTAYTVASLVGASRIRHNAHWFSDVVAGAVIGTSMGRFVTQTNEEGRSKWSVSATSKGVLVSVRW